MTLIPPVLTKINTSRFNIEMYNIILYTARAFRFQILASVTTHFMTFKNTSINLPEARQGGKKELVQAMHCIIPSHITFQGTDIVAPKLGLVGKGRI